MKRLILIDGHAILHRAFHALPPLTNSKGELVNAVFGFISMLLRVIHDLKPEYLIVTFDRPKPTFRKKLYTGYQAKRPKMDEGLIPQIEIVHKVIKEMGIPIFEMDGYEADDIIGTLVEKIKNQNAKLKNSNQKSKLAEEEIETVLVTGDKDLLQLVDEHIMAYMPVKGLSESKIYDVTAVEEKFGIKPSQMIDYKALVGDQSDNYPGVPGIGPKTASSLISKFQTLEGIYIHLRDIGNDSLRTKLEKNKDSAEMAKQLATIIRDVPLEVDLEGCRLGNLDRPNVHWLFEEMEFRSLIPRLSSFNIQHTTFNKKDKNKEKNVEQKTLF